MEDSSDTSMDMLQKHLLQWTKLDKDLKQVHKVAADIRKQKDILQSKICPVIQSEQLEDNIFSIPSLQTNICFKEHKTSESLSYKFLEDKCNGYFDSPDKTQMLLQYLKDNRKQESSYVLKSSVLKE
jgi:hypothetical protein